MNDTEIILAKKRLAHDLKILVTVQVIALCVAGLGLYLYSGDVVPNYPEWDEIHLLCGVLSLSGMVVFTVAALWGCGKLMDVPFLPTMVQVYLAGCFIILFFAFILFLPTLLHTLTIDLTLLIPLIPLFYVVPQCFIARWLAKEAKNSTRESAQDGTRNIDE